MLAVKKYIYTFDVCILCRFQDVVYRVCDVLHVFPLGHCVNCCCFKRRSVVNGEFCIEPPVTFLYKTLFLFIFRVHIYSERILFIVKFKVIYKLYQLRFCNGICSLANN